MIFISKNLELLRKRAGLKQAELADKLGVKPNTISNYEKGVSSPDYIIISKLMDLFDITSDQLLFSDLSIANKSRILISEEVTESVFDKFLSKINERDRKIDEKDALLKEKDTKIDQLQTEFRVKSEELFKENTSLKERIRQLESHDKELEHHSMADQSTEAFTSESYGDYGEDFLPTKQPTTSKRSSAGKT